MNQSHPPRFSVTELAVAAGTTLEQVESVVATGLMTPAVDGTFASGDVHRMRIISAFLDVDIPLDVLLRAKQEGAVSFAYYDRLHPEAGPISALTYGELKRSVGERGELLNQLITALGLAEPDDGSRLTMADQELLVLVLDVIAATGTPDLGLRVARLFGDSTRRATQAILGVYGEAVQRSYGDASGIPSPEIYNTFLEPWSRYARIAPELGRWLTARHLSHAIDDFSLTTTEEYLARTGYVPLRDRQPPAIAFVDLVGYTQLARERGDELAARTALDFGQLAERVSARHGGSVVKLLSDGVLLRFDTPNDGITGALELLDELERRSELPSGHAGLAAGPVIERDGDVFGTTVNLAARIASEASSGTLLVDLTAAAGMGDRGPYRAVPMGALDLKGIGEPVELFRVERA